MAKISYVLITAFIAGLMVSQTAGQTDAEKKAAVQVAKNFLADCTAAATATEDCADEDTALDNAIASAATDVCTETVAFYTCYRDNCANAADGKVQLDVMDTTCGACQFVQGTFLVVLLAAIAHVFKH